MKNIKDYCKSSCAAAVTVGVVAIWIMFAESGKRPPSAPLTARTGAIVDGAQLQSGKPCEEEGAAEEVLNAQKEVSGQKAQAGGSPNVIQGVVVNDAGSPVARVQLELQSALDGTVTWREVVTSNGTFELALSGTGIWNVTAIAPGHSEWRGSLESPSGDPLRIRLVRSGVLIVRVVDSSEKAIEGAVVAIRYPTGHPSLHDHLPVQRTGPGGVARFGSLPIGEFMVSADAEGFGRYASSLAVLSSEGLRTEVQLVLGPGGRVTGKFTDSAGARFPKASIALAPASLQASYGRISQDYMRVESNERGEFVFTGIGEGRYRITARSSRQLPTFRRTVEFSVRAGGVTNVDLSTAPGNSVQVAGVLVQDSLPLANAIIRAELRERMGSRCQSQFTTGSNGEFNAVLPGAGKWRFMVSPQLSGEMSVSISLDVDVPDVRAYRVDIAYITGSLVGSLQGPDGAIDREIRVTASGRIDVSGALGYCTATTIADEEGVFELSRIPVGEYSVTSGAVALKSGLGCGFVGAGQFATRTISGVRLLEGNNRQRLGMAMSPGCTILGFVESVGGSPIAYAEVECASGGAAPERIAFPELCGPSGDYCIRGVLPGSYLVRARLGSMVSPWVKVDAKEGEVVSVVNVLLEGGFLRVGVVDKDISTGELSMVVIGEGGVESYYSVAEAGKGGVGPLAPGDYEVRVYSGVGSPSLAGGSGANYRVHIDGGEITVVNLFP